MARAQNFPDEPSALLAEYGVVVTAKASELAAKWSTDLASWAIPDEILSQVTTPPWVHPVAMFTVEETISDSISHQVARAVVPAGGTVLDVGSGGGRAAFALVPPAATVIAVDHQQGMLDEFAKAAAQREVQHEEFLGDWPAVAGEVPKADVVVCHHVAFNVAEIVPFLQALNTHAHQRVVLEIPFQHPLTHLNPLWKTFWDLDRPTQPTAEDLCAIARAMGFDARIEIWLDATWGKRVALPEEERIKFARIRLCLNEDRDAEVAAALIQLGDDQPRRVATIWWDVSA